MMFSVLVQYTNSLSALYTLYNAGINTQQPTNLSSGVNVYCTTAAPTLCFWCVFAEHIWSVRCYWCAMCILITAQFTAARGQFYILVRLVHPRICIRKSLEILQDTLFTDQVTFMMFVLQHHCSEWNVYAVNSSTLCPQKTHKVKKV